MLELELYDCEDGVLGIDFGVLFGGVTGICVAAVGVGVGLEVGKYMSLAEIAGGLEGGVDRVSAGATIRRLGIAAGIAAAAGTTTALT